MVYFAYQGDSYNQFKLHINMLGDGLWEGSGCLKGCAWA